MLLLLVGYLLCFMVTVGYSCMTIAPILRGEISTTKDKLEVSAVVFGVALFWFIYWPYRIFLRIKTGTWS